jgi:hypothetical protein
MNDSFSEGPIYLGRAAILVGFFAVAAIVLGLF